MPTTTVGLASPYMSQTIYYLNSLTYSMYIRQIDVIIVINRPYYELLFYGGVQWLSKKLAPFVPSGELLDKMSSWRLRATNCL